MAVALTAVVVVCGVIFMRLRRAATERSQRRPRGEGAPAAPAVLPESTVVAS
jgi:hypothetical protein